MYDERIDQIPLYHNLFKEIKWKIDLFQLSGSSTFCIKFKLLLVVTVTTY